VNSLTLSIPYVVCHSVFISDFEVYSDSVFADNLWISRDIAFWKLHESALTLFLLLIGCVVREFIDGVDYIRRLALNIHWQFQGPQWLCFRRWFVDRSWHSVFDNSMRQPWLYFCYRFDASVVNSLTLSIPYVGCHLVFIDDFKVYSYFVFASDLWITRDIAVFTIPWVCHDSIFAIDLMRHSWI
jgi:hypothetical protein